MKIAVCGGGSSAHVVAGCCGDLHEVAVWTRRPKDWKQTVYCDIGNEELEADVNCKGTVKLYSDEPKDVITGADLVIMCGPVSIIPKWCEGMAPYLKPDAVVGTLFLQGIHLPSLAKKCGFPKTVSLWGMLLYPFTSRVVTYGERVRVLRSKVYVTCAIGGPKKADIIPLLKQVFLIPGAPPKFFAHDIRPLNHFLNPVMGTSNTTIHPARMRGIYKKWNGPDTTWEKSEIPLFYEGMDQYSSDSCGKVNDDILAVKAAILKKHPDLDLSGVQSWFVLFDSYGPGVKDRSSLLRKFQSNEGYQGVTSPVHDLGNGKVGIPVYHRYLQDDVPYGLCAIRYLAGFFDVPTPEIDGLIIWAQKIMGKEFLVDGKLEGKDAHEHGLSYCSLEELLAE